MARPVSRKVAEKVLRAVEEMYGPFPEDAWPGDRPFLKEPGEETETGWAVCWEGGNEWPIVALDALQEKVPEAFLEPLSSWGLGVYRPW